MISFAKYGYRSAAAFLRASPSKEVIEAVAADECWAIAKRALLHKDCPLDLREKFRNSSLWYKRFVAIFATKAPPGFILYALKDSDKRVRRAYLEPLHRHTVKFLTKLEVL